nr:hypothetical protein [Endozoicomonas sp.]
CIRDRVYGASFKVQYPNEKALQDAYEEWGECIAELNRPQMDAGFKKLTQTMSDDPKAWKFPNIAATVNLCKPKPADYGMPEPYDAWLEVQKHSHEPLQHSWSHRAVFIAGQYTHWFDIRNATSPGERRELQKRFEKEYQRVVMRLFITGSDQPHEALENQNVELTPVEMSQRHNENIQKEIMEQQGINPQGGRSQYLSRLKAMGLSTASRDEA